MSGVKIEFHRDSATRIDFSWSITKPMPRQRPDGRYETVEQTFPQFTSMYMGDHHMNCCGMRVMSQMYWMMEKPLQTKEVLERLVHIFRYDIGYGGGDMCFILNQSQRHGAAPLLALMAEMGHLTEQEFFNRNMGHSNWLYIWDYKTNQRGKIEHALYR